VAVPLQVVGLAAFASGYGLVLWTLLSNPYASSAVRIQADRDQHVVDTGPYAWVRHPMYLAVVLVVLGSGPALGSWAAAPVLWPILAVFVRRTLLEDAMLHAELGGYRDYAARVPWRIVPGVF
jgi:protein-S-isoprenylcysteine O-methyltransferase Ste14